MHARGREPRSAARVRAREGVRAAFLTSAGYGEAGDDGPAGRSASWSRSRDELGILLAGPNGQGVVSTPARLCAQIVAPEPARRAGSRSRASRATSSRRSRTGPTQTGVGVSRAVSAGNAAAVGIADYLDWYADATPRPR